jgi:hypothetical protein
MTQVRPIMHAPFCRVTAEYATIGAMMLARNAPRGARQ